MSDRLQWPELSMAQYASAAAKVRAGGSFDKVAARVELHGRLLRDRLVAIGMWVPQRRKQTRYDQALALHESGLTFADVGKRMGITEDGARGMASRARRARG